MLSGRGELAPRQAALAHGIGIKLFETAGRKRELGSRLTATARLGINMRLTNRSTRAAEANLTWQFECCAAARSTRSLDPRQASWEGAMLGKLSQTANVSTLLEAKKESSFVV